jgi:hypothetical protein
MKPMLVDRRREVGVLVFGLVMLMIGLLLAPRPVEAHHVNVPTAPITNVELRLGEYATGTPANCGDTVGFTNLRVEVVATVDARPSEHWTTRVEVKNPRGFGSGYWLWPHQNIGPHGHRNIIQGQVPLFTPGDYQVRVLVVGDESGNRFEVICPITKR